MFVEDKIFFVSSYSWVRSESVLWDKQCQPHMGNHVIQAGEPSISHGWLHMLYMFLYKRVYLCVNVCVMRWKWTGIFYYTVYLVMKESRPKFVWFASCCWKLIYQRKSMYACVYKYIESEKLLLSLISDFQHMGATYIWYIYQSCFYMWMDFVAKYKDGLMMM